MSNEKFSPTIEGWNRIKQKIWEKIESSVSKIGNLSLLNTSNKTNLVSAINEVSEKAPFVEITYAELKSLRDANKLVKGTQYRITDYHCTTTQEDTQSADHQFDIIVTADDEGTLNENARACLHKGDTYFSGANANLSAWELKYSLDNDTERFAWADTTNGKGVIYFMKDEWNNECPYDFKNVQFKRKISLDNGYPKLDTVNGTERWVHTFCATSYNMDDDEWSDLKDGSLESPYGHESEEDSSTFHDNIIKSYYILYDDNDEKNTKCGKIYLNDNVLLGWWTELGEPDSDYFFAYCCYYNTFGDNCRHNTFGIGCYDNTFGSSCYLNTFGINCYSNTFGSYCYRNTFGSYCGFNTFGNNCYSNTFGNSCYSNTFGNSCNSNTFGNACTSNTFGGYCYCNTFGNASGANSYYKFITLESGVQNTRINSTQTTSASRFLQNVHICSGVKGTSNTNRKVITIPTVGNAFLTTVGTANDTKIEV